MNVSEFGGNGYGNGVKLDFSAALNPLGIPAAVKRAVSESKSGWADLPDPDCTMLRKRLSVYENIPMENIVCGSGGDDLIFRIIGAVRPKNALIFSPCSELYSRVLLQSGCNVTDIRLSLMNGFTVTSEITEYIDTDTDMIFLCSPNDPTGEVITPYTLSNIAEKCRRTNIFMVCDERYMEFVYRNERYSAKQVFGSKIIIIKSFTKFFSMAGLPVGYALCGDEKLAEDIKNAGSAYSISGTALAAAEAAAESDKFIKMSRKYVAVERKRLSEELTRLGLPVFPSKANFLLVNCELPLDKLLLKKGILIKSCSESYGIDEGYFRIAVRQKDDNDSLISAIEKILQTY